MSGKRLVVPGEHLGSCEEYIAGKNTVTHQDDIYSSAFGEMEVFGRMLQVNTNKNFVQLTEGADAYCAVREISETKAFLTCTPITKVDERSNSSFDAVLPVSAILHGYVERIRDEVRIGDIIKAKISKIDKQQNIDVSIIDQGYGVVKAFCTKCRSAMIINDNKIMCMKCNRVETRKLPYGSNPVRQSRGGSYGNKRSKFR